MSYTEFMKTLFLVLLLTILGHAAQAQQSPLRLPRDSMNTPLIGGLGLPYVYEPSLTNTTYDNSHRVQLPTTGPDTLRQFRHFWMYNPNGSISVYACAGGNDAASCTRDHWVAPPSTGFVDDFGYFGQGNNVTYLYFRIGSAGTIVPSVRYW